MAYTVLARRYRSDSFDQLVGQEPIARTLQSAIATGRVAHAYLFTGTRGVGKTSMARLFARALNAPDTIPGCPKPSDTKKSDFPPLDVQQRSAQAIMHGEDLNVIEIDGASNNSVDQARQLIAAAGLAPTDQARYKVYIIDEVHMLSSAAFNALLKTMEEPPEHVKFILCTTEVHKVPITIQSRCQRFDFRNIPAAKIAEHLKAVVKSEKIAADESVIWQVAWLGNGSMRDALSLLDRLLAAGSKTLSAELLAEMLGLPPQQRIVDLIDSLAAGDAAAALHHTAELLESGVSQDQLLEVLIDRLRQLMILCACGPDSDLAELSDDARAGAQQQAQHFDAPGLVYMIALCENLQRSARASSHPRALLDATIVRLALAEKMADVTALLRQSGGRSAGGGVPPARPVAPGVRPAPPGEQKKKSLDPEPSAPSARPIPAATPVAAAPVPSPPAAPPPTDPAAIWSAVLDQAADKAPIAWVRHLEMRGFDGRRALVAPLPGQRDLIKFLSPQRCEQLAGMIAHVIRRPVKVEVDPTAAAPVDTPTPTDHPAAPSTPGTSGAGADRAHARNLPLVRRVLEVFEASVIDVAPEAALQAPAASAAPAPARLERRPSISDPAGEAQGDPQCADELDE
jgi:DNA polymerase-3 subunit gamma/tau